MILDDAAFRRVLAAAGIADLEVNDRGKAKHTETTRRFRATLILASGQRLPTKIEFSRRGIDETQTTIERIHPEVARRHGRTAYSAQHYVGSSAARQKIEALAGRPQTQARDLFDLVLLDARGVVGDALLRSIEAVVRERAIAATCGPAAASGRCQHEDASGGRQAVHAVPCRHRLRLLGVWGDHHRQQGQVRDWRRHLGLAFLPLVRQIRNERRLEAAHGPGSIAAGECS